MSKGYVRGRVWVGLGLSVRYRIVLWVCGRDRVKVSGRVWVLDRGSLG